MDTTTKKIMARLDDYLPELNTSLMDGRVQDVIIKHPMVRSLMVPEADQSARRRCVRTLKRAVDAATPVLPLILQDHARSRRKGNKMEAMKGSCTASQIFNASLVKGTSKFKNFNVPQLSMEVESRLINYITTLSDKEPFMHFWMNHHIEYQKISASTAAAAAAAASSSSNAAPRKRRQSEMASPNEKGGAESTLNLYLRLKIFLDILEDLDDRVQGSICMVFWECWDEVFMALAAITGDDELEQAQKGRLFRMSGDAAIYVDNRNSVKRHKLVEQQRLSIIKEEEADEQPQFEKFSGDAMFASLTMPSGSFALSNSSPGLSASPSSLTTDDSNSIDSGSEKSNNNYSSDDGIPLIDESEIVYAMDNEFMKFNSAEKLGHSVRDPRNEMVDVFTTLHDVGDLLKSRASSTTSLKSLKNFAPLDLRSRIKLMEEGQSSFDESANSASSHIVW